MADDSQPIKYVYVDSTNRDTTLYPDGSQYVLHLTAPIHSVIQVDLVAAKVPNTMYNLTDGSNVLVFSTASTTSNISVAPGFYSPCGLSRAIMNSGGGTAFCIEYLEDEGRYLFSSSVQFTLKGTTSEIRKLLGLDTGTLSSFSSASNPIYTIYTSKWLYKSTQITNFSTNEYVFLDIDELRTTSVIDAKKLINGTTDGATMRSTFGQVPMDVPSGSIKSFKETSDYKQFVQFTTPIPKLQRLTIQWVDNQGQLLNFQGFNNNAFTLRFHCEYRKVPEPPPPLRDVELKRIVEAMTIALPPPPKEEDKKFRIPWFLLVLATLIGIFIWRTFGPKPPGQPIQLQK